METKDQVKAAILMAAAVGGAIQELGSVPSGHLYARLMDKMGLDTFNALIGALKGAGLVSESGHLLTWVGPKK